MRLRQQYIKKIKINYKDQFSINSMLKNDIKKINLKKDMKKPFESTQDN